MYAGYKPVALSQRFADVNHMSALQGPRDSPAPTPTPAPKAEK